jgi:hypothetical protein
LDESRSGRAQLLLAYYVLIAEIVEVERFEQQASEHVQRLTDDLEHLVSSRGMLVVRTVL